MKKILFCNIPMKDNLDKVVYTSDDISIPVSNQPVSYAINAFLKETITKDDEFKVVLLAKTDEFSHCNKNIDIFKSELEKIIESTGATAEYTVIYTEFSEEKEVHEDLLIKIVDELEEDANIMADITFGSKDLPIVLFSALNFAEKFFNCTIDNIIYGQANFKDGKPINTKICDMVALYYLNSITNTMECNSSQKAKQLLKTLVRL